MEILRGINFKIRNSAVSLGKFDGIHQGHRLLLEEILQGQKGISTVFTFEMGKQTDANGSLFRQQIYEQHEKDQLLDSLGIEREVIFPFDEGTRQMAPEEFIERILYEAMDARFICVGEDFHFGKDRSGNVSILQKYAVKYNYELKVVPKLQMDGDVVSSTRIRSLLQKGELQQANQLLGAPFFFTGEVVHGNALGRTMQMPTANIHPSSTKVLPPAGVYATTVFLGGSKYKAVTNLGYKPTVGSAGVGVESCLFDFDQDIYGEEITVCLHKFIRAEQKFATLEDLRKQMLQDKAQAVDALRNF